MPSAQVGRSACAPSSQGSGCMKCSARHQSDVVQALLDSQRLRCQHCLMAVPSRHVPMAGGAAAFRQGGLQPHRQAMPRATCQPLSGPPAPCPALSPSCRTSSSCSSCRSARRAWRRALRACCSSCTSTPSCPSPCGSPPLPQTWVCPCCASQGGGPGPSPQAAPAPCPVRPALWRRVHRAAGATGGTVSCLRPLVYPDQQRTMSFDAHQPDFCCNPGPDLSILLTHPTMRSLLPPCLPLSAMPTLALCKLPAQLAAVTNEAARQMGLRLCFSQCARPGRQATAALCPARHAQEARVAGVPLTILWRCRWMLVFVSSLSCSNCSGWLVKGHCCFSASTTCRAHGREGDNRVS